MGNMGKFDCREMKKLQEELKKLQDPNQFVEDCTKELAARLLRLVIKRTPVSEYDKPVNFVTKGGKHVSFQPHTGKKGGTLRRGWTGNKKVSVKSYAESMEITKEGNVYKIEIVNPVEYASYVEYGHRTANHKGWVKGQFMMTISEQELQQMAPAILERKIQKYLGGVMH